MKTHRPFRHAVILLAAVAILALPAAAQRKPRGESRDSWQQSPRVMRDLNFKEGDRVADIGAGRGYLAFPIAKLVGENGKVFATEIDAKAVKAMDDRIEKEKITNVQTVLSDATKTKLEADSVEAAIICNVLHHVPKDQRAPLVKDIARAIRPGGYFYILDWRVDAPINHDKDRRVPKDQLVKLATDAGLVLDAEFHYLKNQVFLRFLKPAPKPKAAQK